MLKRKEAPGLLAGLAAGFVLCGCVSPPRQNDRWTQPRPGVRESSVLPPDKTPVVNLRIPEQPKATSEPAPAADAKAVQVAALQAPSVVAPQSPDTNLQDKLQRTVREAQERYAQIDSYIVRLKRREQINGKDKPEEIMLLKFRKQPWSVYYKWLGAEGAGREVVYVKGKYEDKIQSLLAAGDVPLMPAGKRLALSPDSLLVRSNSRHSIFDSGIGSLVDRFGRLVGAVSRGDMHLGNLKYLGPVHRPEFNVTCEAFEQIILPGAEQSLPRGGRRLWVFDPTLKLPVLTTAQDETGHDVEYYCYDRLQYPVRLDDDDFNPDKLWPPKR